MSPENRWLRVVAEIVARDGISADEASTNLANLLNSLPPAPKGLPRERLAVRTDSRTSPELLRAQVEAFGYTTLRHEHIGGAWNPRLGGNPAPVTTIDFWRRGENYNLPALVANAEAAGFAATDVVVEFTLPLGLRGIPTPKDTKTAAGIRRQLADVADLKHRWGAKGSASDTRPYIGTEGVDQIRTYAAAVADACERTGVQVTARQAWECWGFKVFVWSSGGVPDMKRRVQTEDGITTLTGIPITSEMNAVYHTDGALDEFIAAYKVQADVLAEYGIPVTMCGDKRAFDVMADGPYAGRVISDVLAEQLGPIVARPQALGPSWWGADIYVEQRCTAERFGQQYRPVLDHIFRQCAWFGLPFASGEWGIGSGAEDVSDGELVDTDLPFELMFGYLDGVDSDQLGMVNLYVPNNHHRLVPKSKRRQWVFDYLDADASAPIYQHELKG